MKQVITKGCLFLLAATFFLACQKNTEEPQAYATLDGLAAKVTTYLQSQRSATKPARNAKLDDLQKALLLLNLRVERRSETEQLVIVPLAKDFTVRKNRDKHPLMHLVLSLQNGEIKQANLVQYMPEGGEQATALPANTFARIYRYENLACDGMFAVLGLVGEYKFDLTFENGRRTMLREVRDKNPNAPAVQQQRTGEVCINWWLVTTTYWTDGSTTVEYDFLFQQCGECGMPGPSGEATLCDELNDDALVGEILDYEFEGIAYVWWQAYVSPDGLNKIISTERLYGKRKPNNGSKFTHFIHQDDGVSNQMQYGHDRYATWHKDDWHYTLTGDKKNGTASLSGILTYPSSPTVDISNKTHSWNAHAELQ